MSVYRGEFYRALQAMLGVSGEPLLQDVLPVGDPHNVSARILRHGIAVSAFAVLETYVKSILEYLVSRVALSPIIYTQFPDKLRKFISVDSISGFNNNLYFIRDEAAKMLYVDSHIASIAGYSANPPRYTSFGFSPTGANVGHEDVKKGFGAFGMNDAWGELDSIATLIGASSLSLNNDFKTLAQARHSSAHDPAGNIPTATLQSNLNAAVLPGVTIDLLAKGLGSAIQSCADPTRLAAAITGISHPVRFLDQQLDGTWLERPTLTARGVRKYADLAAGQAGISSRKSFSYIVVRDTSTRPIELLY